MARVIKTAKTLRNHWKKSTFAAIILSYGGSKLHERNETSKLMQIYCKRAAEYGRLPIRNNDVPKTVTVILNPNANKRSAAEDFETYCAPILNLAGICIEIVKTEFEGHAKELVQNLSNTDSIVVAGGDGTLCEVVTGLLRRTGENPNNLVPIGVLPLGKHNSLASELFPGGANLAKIKSMLDASMAVVEEATKPVDVMKIEQTSDLNEAEAAPKPIYALSSIKWGAFRDVELRKDKYWYFGSLRNYVAYIFNGYKQDLTWNCEADVNFTPPCQGCSNCAIVRQNSASSKWFQKFAKTQDPNAELLKVDNPECKLITEKSISTFDFSLQTSTVESSTNKDDNTSKLHLSIGPNSIDYIDFVKQGWSYEKSKNSKKYKEKLEARQIELNPKHIGEDNWFSIDNDNFEVKPVKITLLPKIVTMFCKKEFISS